MTCDDYRSGFIFYARHELPPAEESAMAAHLAECAECRREFESEIAFSREVHNASAPFRDAAARIGKHVSHSPVAQATRLPRRRGFSIPGARRAAWPAAGLALAAAIIVFVLVQRVPVRETDDVPSWAVRHYALIDQAHPLRGDEETVRAWFKEHHGIDVTPPRNADYATLTGCKMVEIDSLPAPLLRFEGADTSAVFMLPARFRSGSDAGTIRKEGYIIRVWSEGAFSYLKITPDSRRGT